jgi:hypothetical protein
MRGSKWPRLDAVEDHAGSLADCDFFSAHEAKSVRLSADGGG